MLFPAGQDANSFASRASETRPARSPSCWRRRCGSARRLQTAGAGLRAIRVGRRSAAREKKLWTVRRGLILPQPPSRRSWRMLSPLARCRASALAGEELRVGIEDRRWRVRGLARVTSFDVLRVNVLVARTTQRGDVSMSTRWICIRRGRGACFAGRPPASWVSRRSWSRVISAGCCWFVRSTRSRRSARRRRRQARGGAEQGGAGGGARAAARPRAGRPDRRRLCGGWGGRRGDELPGRLSGGGLEASWIARWR